MAVSTGNMIIATELKTKIKNLVNSILPSTGYWDANSALPDMFYSSYLTTRAAFYNELVSKIDNYTINSNYIKSGYVPLSLTVFSLLQEVFKEMGRCRKVYYYQWNSTYVNHKSPTTVGEAASSIASRLNATSGTWTYFKPSVALSGTLSESVATGNNGSVSNVAIGTHPSVNTGWYNNTRLPSNASRKSALNTNQTIVALTSIDQQLDEFKAKWQARNNTNAWWNGAQSSANTGNGLLFVRYWCHSNCYTDHSDRSRR